MSADKIARFLVSLERRNCVVFGSGPAAQEFLDRLRVPVAFIVDNDQRRWGETVLDIEIRSPQSLEGISSRETAIVIASSAVEDITNQLVEKGFDRDRDILISPFVEALDGGSRHARLLVSCYGDGGGLYVVDTATRDVERVLEGSCRGLLRDGTHFIVADEAAGLLKLDAIFNVVCSTPIDPMMNVHGICYDADRAAYLVLETANDAIGIYDRNTLELRERLTFRGPGQTVGGNDAHHINHLNLHEGRLYASMFSLNGVWRNEVWTDGAVVELDRETGALVRVLVHGLAQPHSVHFEGAALHFCNSMEFEVRTDREQVFQTNAYTRGLASQGTTMFIGQSRVRRLERFRKRFAAISRDTGINVLDRPSQTYTFIPLPAEGLFDVIVL